MWRVSFFSFCLSPSNIVALTNCISGLTSWGVCGRKVDTELQTAGHKWAPLVRLSCLRERVQPGRSAVMHPRRIGSIYLAGSDAG